MNIPVSLPSLPSRTELASVRDQYVSHKCLIFRNAVGIRIERYCKFTSYGVLLVDCVLFSLTVTEYDIDSVTCEMVRMVSSYGDQSTNRE